MDVISCHLLFSESHLTLLSEKKLIKNTEEGAGVFIRLALNLSLHQLCKTNISEKLSLRESNLSFITSCLEYNYPVLQMAKVSFSESNYFFLVGCIS